MLFGGVFIAFLLHVGECVETHWLAFLLGGTGYSWSIRAFLFFHNEPVFSVLLGFGLEHVHDLTQAP